MIRSNNVRDTLTKRLVLPESVYRLVSSQKISLLTQSIARIGLTNPPTFRMHPDGQLELVAGRKRLASVLALKHKIVRIRVIECDDDDVSLIRASEDCFSAGSETERSAAHERMVHLVGVLKPAPPPDAPVKRVTPKRLARDMLSDQLGLSPATASARQQRINRTREEDALMLRDPDSTQFIMALRSARSTYSHLTSLRASARKLWGPDCTAVQLANQIMAELDSSWPLAKCCQNAGCPKCLGRGWSFGKRRLKRPGRPLKKQPADIKW